MMEIFQTVEDALFGSAGSLYLVAILIMAFFFILFLMFNIDFRLALMIESPLLLAFSEIGWFPAWVAGVFWILIVGIGLFIAWNFIKER